jgi:hypothetical protein
LGENIDTIQKNIEALLDANKETGLEVMGKPEGKRPLGRSRCGWEDAIRMDLRDIGWGSVDWIQLAQDRDWWLL